MLRRLNHLILPFAALASFLVEPAVLRADVDLEWRPARQSTTVGEIVEIKLYAVSDTGDDQSVGGLEAILTWDPDVLELMGNVDPCDGGACPPNTYDWHYSVFRSDSTTTGLNNTFVDGDALYWALAWPAPAAPAVATEEGLWVTTLQFQAIGAGSTALSFLAEFTHENCTQVTPVADGYDWGVDVTGVLGQPAEVLVGCVPPSVSAIGARYLAVAPMNGSRTLTLLISGDADDPDVSCMSFYIQPDGTLDVDPVFLTPDEWGVVHVTDAEIAPSTTYHVQAVCRRDVEPDLLSEPASVTTWLWGDTNNDGAVFFDDITLVIGGAQGIFPPGVIAENVDLLPCTPDGVIDDDDIAAVQDAFEDGLFPCSAPCVPGLGLDDFAVFAACMGGPDVPTTPVCERFDYGADDDVDLADFVVFQRLFDGLN